MSETRMMRILRNELDEATEALEHIAQACEEHWADPPRVACICPDCPTTVPVWWVSSMCMTCANEDCEHPPVEPMPRIEPERQPAEEEPR